MSQNNPRLGITLMIITMLIFATQDGFSRQLAGEYNVITVVMIRYWFFAAFVITLSSARAGGLRRVARTSQPGLQIFRGVLLVAQICVAVLAFTLLGLVATHAIFAVYPLMVAALSGPLLGEKVGKRRWIAIGVGFLGVLIILRPGFQVFAPEAMIALLGALIFALYGLLTRYVARRDSAETSFFYTGVAGAVAITLIGPFFWEPMVGAGDWALMGVLCLTGATGHFLLIKTLEIAEASTVQPFAYFQLVFVSVIGVGYFHEPLDPWIMAGAAVVIAAGLFTLWRSRLSGSPAPVPAQLVPPAP